MKMIKPKANLGRNAFDLSHRNVFTANFGELLPCCCIETVPSNDYIEIKPADMVRAMPLATSPFLRAKQHIDFWFVPYQALWSRFNEFMSDKDEPTSASLKNRGFLPHTGLADIYSAMASATSASAKDIVGRDFADGSHKLLNLLGYSAPNAFLGNSREDYKVNLFRLAAYNFIWYKEYRQQYYDTGLHLFGSSPTSVDVAKLWNFDDVSCLNQSNADVFRWRSSDENIAMIQLRYRCWKKDLFTGLLPSQQFGNVSQITSANIANSSSAAFSIQGLATGNVVSTNGTIYVDNNGTPVAPFQPAAAQIKSQVSVLDLRKAEAVQKWRENALRAGNQIEDNFESHYGAKPHSHLISHPTYIGSYDSSLSIGDVVSTAETGSGTNQQLGDIAGKGILSLDGKTIKFKSTDFGIVMGIFSILPEAEYNALGVDRMNQLLEREDFFIPEYENLGLEPVSAATFWTGGIPSGSTNLLGFAPRYWGYKQKFDQCFGEMMHTNSKTGMLSHWCSPKTDVPAALTLNTQLLPLSCLYINPKLFDINFSVGISLSDQFIVDLFNDVTAIRGMSVSGMPSY